MWCITAILLGVITGGSVVYYDLSRAIKHFEACEHQEAVEKLERILERGNYSIDIGTNDDRNVDKSDMA